MDFLDVVGLCFAAGALLVAVAVLLALFFAARLAWRWRKKTVRQFNLPGH